MKRLLNLTLALAAAGVTLAASAMARDLKGLPNDALDSRGPAAVLSSAPDVIDAANGYTFSQSAGTYTEVGASAATLLSGAVDDDKALAQSIGFTFNFNGNVFTQYSVCANGHLAFGATMDCTYNQLPLSSAAASNNNLAVLGFDLKALPTGSVKAEVTGASPGRVLTVQWKDFAKYYSSTSTENYNFQIKLHEGSNVIDYVYGPFTVSSGTNAAQVGLRGASNADYSNRSSTTSWAATTAGANNAATVRLTTAIKPTPGQTFTWSPPNFPPAIAYSALVNTTSTANASLTGVAISDDDGVDVSAATGPRLYYKRASDANAFNDNTSATDGWKYAQASGATSPFDFTIDYSRLNGGAGVAVGDVIQYFVVAQDLSGPPLVGINAGTFAAAPASVDLTAAAFPIGGAIKSYRISQLLSGTIQVPGDYASLTKAGGAFEAINNNLLSGNIVIEIVGDLSGETGAVALNQAVEQPAGSNFTITIKPNGAARTISGASAANTGLITLNDADRVTIDGSLSGGTDQSLTISNSATGGVTIWLHSAVGGDGASGNTFKNLLLNGATASGATTVSGILSSGATFGGDAEAPNSNNTIRNNVITRVQNALYLRGGAPNLDQGWLVVGNTLGSTTAADKLTFRGMLIGNAQDFTVRGNTILGVVSTSSSTSNVSGIQAALAISGGSVEGNRISDIKQINTTGYGSNGIYLAASSALANLTVTNNFVTDIASYGFNGATPSDNGYGIVVASGAGYGVYYNSVLLATEQTAVASITAALNIANTVTAGPIDVRDNIFATTQTVGTRYAVYSAAPASVFSTIDNNDYFPGTGSVGYLGSAKATLADWQAASGQDAHSIATDPLFVSAADLHLSSATSPAVHAGTPIAGVTTDIDGDARNATTPDIGADEFAAAVVTYTVTPSVTGDGTITPDSAQTVNANGTVDFELHANTGSHFVNVTGGCPGSLSGTTWTAGPITEDCSLVANFAPDVVAPPTAVVTPNPLTFTVAAGASATNALTIANNGGGTLTWSINEALAAIAHPGKVAAKAPKSAQDKAVQGSRSGHALKTSKPPRGNPLPLAVAVDEGFDDITTLASAGWVMNNRSYNVGAQANWFQGSPLNPDDPTDGVFNAYDGDADAYIAANFQNVSGSGTGRIASNWLLSPPINFSSGASVSFYTRSLFATDDDGNPTTTVFPDRLEVRLCTVGACTNVGTGTGAAGANAVGDFTTLLLSVNPNQTTNDDPTGANGYPLTNWAPFTISSGLPTSGTGRIAFRYYVTSAGPNGNNSNYIGLDRVRINDGSTPPTGCAAPSDVPWLSESLANGSVAGGSSQATDVTVNASSLAAGSYSAHICVATNDTANALVDVPVNVTVTAAATTHTVSTNAVPSLGGTFNPTSVTVNDGAAASFEISPNPGYHFDSLGGNCPTGTWSDTTHYMTGAITVDCTVTANFAADATDPDLVCSAPINHPVAETFNGTYINWITGTFQDNTSLPNYHVNPYSSSGQFALYWGSNTKNAGVASSSSTASWLVLQAGDTVDSGSTFSSSTGPATNWITPEGVDGYLGFSMDCSTLASPPASGVCYGYAHITAGETTGFPATIVDYCYNKAGNAITITGAGGPPSVTKSFSPTQVLTGADSTATIRLINPNATAATLTAALVDTLPNGLVATAASTTCGGSVSFTPGTITLASGATIPQGACTITATVHAAAESSYTNTVHAGDLQTDAGNNAADASATLIVSNTPPFPQPYCSVSFSDDIEPISRVVLTGIDNPSDPTVNASPALENFLSVAGGALSRSGVYSMAVEGNTAGAYTDKVKVFIDWNQNGTFEAGEGFSLSNLVDSTGDDGKQSTGDITVPADAFLGETRMRVIKKWDTAADACNTEGYGQAEDYTIVVDNNPLPQPSADVSPFAFAMTAQEGMSATDTMVVENNGPGRLTFNVKRALPESREAGASKVRDTLRQARRNDAIRAAQLGLPLVPDKDDFIGALARGDGKVDVGSTVLANDPLCVVGTPGLVVHDGDGAPDNGYGWNSIAGTDPKYVDKFTPDSYPATYTTVCATFLTNADLASAPVSVVVFADDGPGGAPGTELGRVAVTANNIGSDLVQSFQAFDISDMGLNITEGSVYIGFEWDATALDGLFIASDESSAESAGGYSYSSGEWTPIADGGDVTADYKALFIRAIEESAGEPGVGCDSPSGISWLSATPTSGTINGVGTKDVTIKANAASLTVGTYNALLCVNTNDPSHPQFEIPVTFTVTPNIANDTIFKDGFDGAVVNPNIHDSGVINVDIPDAIDGIYLNWITGATCTASCNEPNFHFDPYGTPIVEDGPDVIHFWWPNAAGGNEGGVGSAATKKYSILAAGATVGPSSEFITLAGNPPADMSNWAAGVDGYLGFKFACPAGVCYGYVNLKTTAPNGFPATIVRYWYDTTGAAIAVQ